MTDREKSYREDDDQENYGMDDEENIDFEDEEDEDQ
jgi:hypothetical protein